MNMHIFVFNIHCIPPLLLHSGLLVLNHQLTNFRNRKQFLRILYMVYIRNVFCGNMYLDGDNWYNWAVPLLFAMFAVNAFWTMFSSETSRKIKIWCKIIASKWLMSWQGVHSSFGICHLHGIVFGSAAAFYSTEYLPRQLATRWYHKMFKLNWCATNASD